MRALYALVLLALPAAADTADVVQDHARPGYAAFAGQAAALAAIDSCDAEILRPAFQSTFDAWLAVAHLHLGPAEEAGRSLAIQFWPDPKGLGWKAQRALLASDPLTLTADSLAEQSVAARGLSGLERLLYPTDPLPADPCPLIHATADDLSRMARDLSDEWAGFGDLLLTAGDPANARFLSEKEATQALFTQLATGLEFIVDRRIGRPLASFDKPRPDLAEAVASGRAQRNLVLSLRALRDLTQRLNPDSPKSLAAFDTAIARAEGLSDPVLADIATPQGHLRLEIVQQAVRTTRDTVISELGPALGVELGFNSQDGD